MGSGLTVSLGGSKGRAAFCLSSSVAKEKRKEADYSEYPLTPHGEMLYAICDSDGKNLRIYSRRAAC